MGFLRFLGRIFSRRMSNGVESLDILERAYMLGDQDANEGLKRRSSQLIYVELGVGNDVRDRSEAVRGYNLGYGTQGGNENHG